MSKYEPSKSTKLPKDNSSKNAYITPSSISSTKPPTHTRLFSGKRSGLLSSGKPPMRTGALERNGAQLSLVREAAE